MKEIVKMSVPLPLVVIAGPTASGKTSLAIDLAKKFNGEIICADSRSIYKGADIGTAKASLDEQSAVPHWGLDLVEPGDYFSVADFKTYADQKIKEIRERGKLPFLVGGTGLYIDAVIFDYKFGNKVDAVMRQKLQHMTLDQLYDYCKENNVKLPENDKNKRYVMRSIENNGFCPSRRGKPLTGSIVVGISTDRSVLRDRIKSRSIQFFNDGAIDEAKKLGDKYGWNSEAMKSNIYPLAHKYIEGDLSLEDAKEKSIIIDWHLAKRQLTWFKRNSFIKWLPLDEAKEYISDQLAKLE